MSLVGVKLFGKSIDDALVFKLIVGIVAIIILVALLGTTSFGDWVGKSLIIQTAVLLFIIPLTYGFVEEHFTWIHIVMIVIGVSMVILYCIFAGFEAKLMAVSIVQSIVWATIFSIIFEEAKNKLDRHKV